MRGLILIAAASLALGLGGCTTVERAAAGAVGLPAAPVVVADRTVLDEQAGITVTLAYVGLSKAAGLLIETGLIKDKALIARIGAADALAINAVRAVREAYLTANSASYTEAIRRANVALKGLSGLLGPNTSAANTAPPVTYNAVYYGGRKAQTLNEAFALAVTQSRS